MTKRCVCLGGHSFCVSFNGGKKEKGIQRLKLRNLNLSPCRKWAALSILYMTQSKVTLFLHVFFFCLIPDMVEN